jgi:hypothetical protein
MVLEKGEVVEYEDVGTLMNNKNSLFYKLYLKSN